MGLDMYLTAKRTCYSWEDRGPELAKSIGEFFGPEFPPINLIGADVGQWRKANHIHKWFVDNVQDGEDNCFEYEVSREDLKTLKVLCETVLNDRSVAKNVLPTVSGFFFGSTEYDEYYFIDLENTIKIVDTSLSMPNEWDFYYSSSW